MTYVIATVVAVCLLALLRRWDPRAFRAGCFVVAAAAIGGAASAGWVPPVAHLVAVVLVAVGVWPLLKGSGGGRR
jgi:hypothetical protein